MIGGELIQTVTTKGLEISIYKTGEGLIEVEVESDPGYRPTVKPMAVSGADVWVKIGRKRVKPYTTPAGAGEGRAE